MAVAGKYQELAAAMARLVETELAPGDQFPTVPELAERFGVHRNTASRAVQHLKEQGLLSGKGGGKTWVRVPPAPTVRRNTRYQEEKDLVLRPEAERRSCGVAEWESGISLTTVYEDTARHDVVDAPDWVAEILEIEPGAKVLRRTRTRRHRKGAGASCSVSYLPYELASRNPELFDESRDPWPGGTMHQLHTLGIEVDRIEDHVTASMPTDEEVAEQDIPPGVPVLRDLKITYATSGRAVEVAALPFPADRAKLVFVTPLERWS
ncbi:GntR family transcriptional regulator [Streptomyces sp. RKND-216]|uniref:GntR family transcriptional regulator n=1 Tax=Streptomyces sp. RKND-216 TaxID=2562581 RepID=UPI00109DFC07|nr:GntR family transcriptional regulator [Streptomyces sp. RKND-216]THA28245.1 GntR family transcriptional regulator [Streptomyces sp. RKND-216]